MFFADLARRYRSLIWELTRREIAERYVGPIADVRHSFPEADALEQLLRRAGFERIQVEALTRDTTFDLPADELVRLNALAVIGMGQRGNAMSDSERQVTLAHIMEASHPAVARYTSDGVIRFRTSANIAVAWR